MTFDECFASVWLVRCNSGSSLRRLGGTVVMRILTVASAELISKPVSLVSMDSTGTHTHTRAPSLKCPFFFFLQCYVWRLSAVPSLGSCVRRVSTTLLPRAATASTKIQKHRMIMTIVGPKREWHVLCTIQFRQQFLCQGIQAQGQQTQALTCR